MQVRHGYASRVEAADWSGEPVQVRSFVEPELRRLIVAASRDLDVTMSEVIRRALRRYFSLREVQ